jgi:hypothetical protein
LGFNTARETTGELLHHEEANEILIEASICEKNTLFWRPILREEVNL